MMIYIVEGVEKMVRKKFNMETELVASENGKHTYEVRRCWGEEGRKGIVLELYPTLSAERCGEMDLSTMHLMNHVKDFGWSSVSIINLYSTVFETKPLTGQLTSDAKNISYIEELLGKEDIGEYDIVIATGSSLSTHKGTIEAKSEILRMLQNKKLAEQVYCIVPEFVDENIVQGTHPLFLGLHHSKEKWHLEKYSIETALNEMGSYLKDREAKQKMQGLETNEKPRKRGKKKDVLQDKESA